MERSASTVLRSYLTEARMEWKPFAIYGLVYALLSLLVPLLVQLLVNNLALVGLGLSLMTLSILMAIGLLCMQFCRLAQIFLLEYLERKILVRYTPRFAQVSGNQKAIFFELASIPKSLGKWALEGFEIFLALVVGTLILMVYHPFFVVLTIAIWISLWGVYHLGRRGLNTALAESKEKYNIWYQLAACNLQVNAEEWLVAREGHFVVLRRQIVLLMLVQVFGSVILLLGGALLFEANQLSLGQFVAAELIGGGVFFSLGKLCKFMESHYALMTSFVKMNHALEVAHE